MSRFKKPVAVVALAAGTAVAAFFGIRDMQFARARETVEDARARLAAANVGQMGEVFRTVGTVMEPSVVNIVVHKGVKAGNRQLPFDDDTLRKLFPNRNNDGQPDVPEGFGGGAGPDDGQMETVGTGSGVIMEVKGGSGFILTNNHVAGGATEMTITLADGREIHNGKVLGTDPKTDLAVIEVKMDRLIPAKWGDSDTLQRGDFVMAFGSPFGYVGSMTHGIVSALNRQAGIIADRQGYESFIQVDCPINPGNSGGPLTNLRGEVVGINTAIASRSGGFQGIGFAIPSDQAQTVFHQLKDKGVVTRGWLGVSITDVAHDLDKAHSFGFKADKGVLVEQTFPNTPATGKLEEGDIITQLNGKDVDNVQTLRNTIATTTPNTELTMKVFRDNKFADVALKVGAQPQDLAAVANGKGDDAKPGRVGEKERPAIDDLGLTLGDLTPALRERLGLDNDIKTGCVVTRVAAKSPAFKAGLRAGDVIRKVEGKDVKDAQEATDAIAAVGAGKDIRFYVGSAAGSHFVFVKVAAE